VLLWTAAIGSLYAGFSAWPLYVIPILGIVWSVGYVLFKPNSRLVLSQSIGVPIGLWAWNSAVCAILYGIGYALGRIL